MSARADEARGLLVTPAPVQRLRIPSSAKWTRHGLGWFHSVPRVQSGLQTLWKETGDVVWESRFPKKAPGTIKEIAPSLGGGLNFELSVSFLR